MEQKVREQRPMKYKDIVFYLNNIVCQCIRKGKETPDNKKNKPSLFFMTRHQVNYSLKYFNYCN